MKSEAAVGIFYLWWVGGVGPTLSAAQNLYVVDNATDSVVQFDGATGDLIGTFASGGGGGAPGFLACAPNGNLLMTRQNGHHAVEFDNATGALVGVFATANLHVPTGLTVGPNRNLFVSNHSAGNIVEFDGATGEFVKIFASGLGGQLFGMAFGPNGNLFVAVEFGQLDGGAVAAGSRDTVNSALSFKPFEAIFLLTAKGTPRYEVKLAGRYQRFSTALGATRKALLKQNTFPSPPTAQSVEFTP